MRHVYVNNSGTMLDEAFWLDLERRLKRLGLI